MTDPSNPNEPFLICPKCQHQMAQVTFGGVTVDRCTNCSGIWFDFHEEAKLKEMWGSQAIEGTRPPADLARQLNAMPYVSCPRCDGGIEMTRLVVNLQSHIWYESCPSCRGIYFDAGEFADFRLYTPLDIVKNLFAPRRD